MEQHARDVFAAPENVRSTTVSSIKLTFTICIVALFVAAIVLNLVIEGGVLMWAMIIFGACVITSILMAGAVPEIRKHGIPH